MIYAHRCLVCDAANPSTLRVTPKGSTCFACGSPLDAIRRLGRAAQVAAQPKHYKRQPADIGAAIRDPLVPLLDRIAHLIATTGKPLSAADIAEMTGAKQNAVYQHLKRQHKARGWVRQRSPKNRVALWSLDPSKKDNVSTPAV